MKIALKNPLCFFDLETTGLSITQDRIVQIAIIKLEQDGSSSELNLIINPALIFGSAILSAFHAAFFPALSPSKQKMMLLEVFERISMC